MGGRAAQYGFKVQLDLFVDFAIALAGKSLEMSDCKYEIVMENEYGEKSTESDIQYSNVIIEVKSSQTFKVSLANEDFAKTCYNFARNFNPSFKYFIYTEHLEKNKSPKELATNFLNNKTKGFERYKKKIIAEKLEDNFEKLLLKLEVRKISEYSKFKKIMEHRFTGYFTDKGIQNASEAYKMFVTEVRNEVSNKIRNKETRIILNNDIFSQLLGVINNHSMLVFNSVYEELKGITSEVMKSRTSLHLDSEFSKCGIDFDDLKYYYCYYIFENHSKYSYQRIRAKKEKKEVVETHNNNVLSSRLIKKNLYNHISEKINENIFTATGFKNLPFGYYLFLAEKHRILWSNPTESELI